MARFMTLDEVRDELNTSSAQVYALVRSGDLPAIKLGGRGQWRVERARFEAWLEDKHDETARWVKANPLGGANDAPNSAELPSEPTREGTTGQRSGERDDG